VSVSERSSEAGRRALSSEDEPNRPGRPAGDLIPPAGEEIHMPGPTLIPFMCAIGITLIVIGTTIDWLFSAIGGVIFIITVVMWIRDTRRDIESLPEEHH
jgi:hypothetical protein